MKLSNRKLKSYKKAEIVARELRYQLSHSAYIHQIDFNILFKLMLKWMDTTGNIKYVRPNEGKE